MREKQWQRPPVKCILVHPAVGHVNGPVCLVELIRLFIYCLAQRAGAGILLALAGMD